MSERKYEFDPGDLVVVVDGSAGHGRIARVVQVVRKFRTQEQYNSYMACHLQQKRWEQENPRRYPPGKSYYSNPPDWKVGDEVEHRFLTEGVLSPDFTKGPRVKREHRAISLVKFDEAWVDEEVKRLQEGLDLARELVKGR